MKRFSPTTTISKLKPFLAISVPTLPFSVKWWNYRNDPRELHRVRLKYDKIKCFPGASLYRFKGYLVFVETILWGVSEVLG
jgi:hypothetical protein